MARNQIDGGGPTPVAKTKKPTYRPLPSATPTTRVVQQKESIRNSTAPVGSQGNQGVADLAYRGQMNALTSASNQAAQRAALASAAGGGGGGYGGGGAVGGGGGGAAGPTQASFDAYMAAMQRLLSQGGPVQAMKHPLAGKIDPAMTADIQAAQAAFKGIPQQTNNPFTGMQFQAPTLSPSLQRFVESQGGDVGAYQNQVAASNVGLQSGAADWNSLAQVLGGNVTAAQQDARAANDMQLQAIVSALRGQGSQMNTGVAMQQAQFEQQAREQQAAMEAARQQALAQALSTGLQYGFTPPKGF